MSESKKSAECKHDFEPNIDLTEMRCCKCGQEAPRKIKSAEEIAQSLTSKITYKIIVAEKGLIELDFGDLEKNIAQAITKERQAQADKWPNDDQVDNYCSEKNMGPTEGYAVVYMFWPWLKERVLGGGE